MDDTVASRKKTSKGIFSLRASINNTVGYWRHQDILSDIFPVTKLVCLPSFFQVCCQLTYTAACTCDKNNPLILFVCIFCMCLSLAHKFPFLIKVHIFVCYEDHINKQIHGIESLGNQSATLIEVIQVDPILMRLRNIFYKLSLWRLESIDSITNIIT